MVLCLILMSCFVLMLPLSLSLTPFRFLSSRLFCFVCYLTPLLFSLSSEISTSNFTLKLRCVPYCVASIKAPEDFLHFTQFMSRFFFLSPCELKHRPRVVQGTERNADAVGGERLYWLFN